MGVGVGVGVGVAVGSPAGIRVGVGTEVGVGVGEGVGVAVGSLVGVKAGVGTRVGANVGEVAGVAVDSLVGVRAGVGSGVGVAVGVGVGVGSGSAPTVITGSASNGSFILVRIPEDPGERISALSAGGGNRICEGFISHQDETDCPAFYANPRLKKVRPYVAEPWGQGFHHLTKAAVPGGGNCHLQPTARRHRVRVEGPVGAVGRSTRGTGMQHPCHSQDYPNNHQQRQPFSGQALSSSIFTGSHTSPAR